YDAEQLFPVPPGSLDAVVVHLNYHDLVLQGVNHGLVNAQIFAALRPGGVLGIVDHSAPAGSGDEFVSLHRIDPDFVTRELERAGFRLTAASSALHHSDDDRTWSTAPRAAGARRGTS